MSRSLTGFLILTLIFAGSYFWYVAQAICPIPISYYIGEFDERFGITQADARTAISEAESLWEDATGINLFTYDREGTMPINFVFDDRQQFTDEAEAFNERLDQAQAINAEIEAEYTQLVAEYTELTNQLSDKTAAYDRAIDRYNQEVDRWNEAGGAPQEVFNQLNARKAELDNDKATLQSLDVQVDQLNNRIVELTEQANIAIEQYNQKVETFNDVFTEPTEFTQGDYFAGRINIYQFGDQEELVLALAHELGHALGVKHVENETSIMFMRMQAQSSQQGLSAEDLTGFTAACGDGSTWSKLTAIKFW